MEGFLFSSLVYILIWELNDPHDANGAEKKNRGDTTSCVSSKICLLRSCDDSRHDHWKRASRGRKFTSSDFVVHGEWPWSDSDPAESSDRRAHGDASHETEWSKSQMCHEPVSQQKIIRFSSMQFRSNIGRTSSRLRVALTVTDCGEVTKCIFRDLYDLERWDLDHDFDQFVGRLLWSVAHRSHMWILAKPLSGTKEWEDEFVHEDDVARTSYWMIKWSVFLDASRFFEIINAFILKWT